MPFQSPFAPPFRNRNRTPFRSRGRLRKNSFNPAHLSPFAWYDNHIGGSSTQITDSSGNGRDAVTFGATTSSPLWLPYTGVAYVHLEAASSGTNSISCTAPANTASFSAVPLGGGAATTGAAAEGAFAFTTAGDWESISLLTAGAVELARFRAADSTQTGHSDAYSVAWTVNRGTAGRKTVVLSLAANSNRSVVLFGTNDLGTIPLAATPALGTSDAATFVAITRGWATPVSTGRIIQTQPTGARLVIFQATTTHDVSVQLNDGTNAATATTTTGVAGTRQVHFVTVNGRSAAGLSIQLNNDSAVTANNSAVGSATSAAATAIAHTGSGAGFRDMELEAFVLFTRVLTTIEKTQLVAYYRGGL